jgi:hypothetical protein
MALNLVWIPGRRTVPHTSSQKGTARKDEQTREAVIMFVKDPKNDYKMLGM